MLLFPDSGPKKNFRFNGFTKTVTPRLCSIVRHVQRHMAYFAGPVSDLSCREETLTQQKSQEETQTRKHAHCSLLQILINIRT